MNTENNTPVPTPLEVAVRDLCGKVDAYLKQGCLRSELYHVNERVKALLDSTPEQPVVKKSNTLFDKCVENCDPVTMKEVSDNVDKMLGREPVEGLEEEISSYWNRATGFQPKFAVLELTKEDLAKVANHFADWGASHAVAPYYFKLRDIKTGRVFLAEWSDIAGEWYERGNGKAYQSEEVEIVKRDQKTTTP